MSIAEPFAASEAAPAGPPENARSRRRPLLRRLADALMIFGRLAIGALLCFHPITALLAVGWTFRLMRRGIWRRWWIASGAESGPITDFESLRASWGDALPARSTPRWFPVERVREQLRRPLADGRSPGRLRRVLRLPGAALGGLRANLLEGLRATGCTYVLTIPGCFLWLAAWYDGWNNSFTKGYEQAAVGPLTGILGNVLFIAAMFYVPMAWAHLAATNHMRSFFQFTFNWALVRRSLPRVVIYAAMFAVLTLPVSFLRAFPVFLPNIDPTLETAAPERIRYVANMLIGWGGAATFLLFVAVHLLAARLYRKALLQLLSEEPWRLDELDPGLRDGLSRLGLISERVRVRRPLLVKAVLGSGRTAIRGLLWVALFVLWFGMVAQIYVVEFLNYHPVTGWMNQPLVHLPSVYFIAGGS